MKARQVLAGRREGELLAFPSVRQMTDVLSMRCREQSWVRISVATLDRFRIREWGLPGSRFVGPEELPMEEYR
jgi:hypothetical protein